MVTTTTAQYGAEISWEIVHLDTGNTCGGSNYTDENGGIDEECCLPDGGEYELVCMDSYGDGWHGGFLTIVGEAYCDSSFESEQRVVVQLTGACVWIWRGWGAEMRRC